MAIRLKWNPHTYMHARWMALLDVHSRILTQISTKHVPWHSSLWHMQIDFYGPSALLTPPRITSDWGPACGRCLSPQQLSSRRAFDTFHQMRGGPEESSSVEAGVSVRYPPSAPDPWKSAPFVAELPNSSTGEITCQIEQNVSIVLLPGTMGCPSPSQTALGSLTDVLRIRRD